MATIEEMAGEQELELTARGKIYKTGPVTIWHLMQGRKRLVELVGEKDVKDPTRDLTLETTGVLLTQLFEEAELIPAGKAKWEEKVQWVVSQFTIPDLWRASKAIDNAMPEEMKAEAKKAQAGAARPADVEPGQSQFIPPGTLET